MRRALLLLPLLLASSLRADLASDVRSILATGAIAKSETGVQIIRLGQLREQDEKLVSVNADTKLIPASNLKIITTAAALETLGADFKFNTRLVMNETRDLAVIGDGDPTFGDNEYLEGTGWICTTVFEKWADQLVKSGITRVNDVLVDDSIFEELMMQPNWPLDQAHKDYVPQVAGMNFNANCLDVLGEKSGGTVSVRTEPVTKYVTLQNQLTTGPETVIYLSRVLGGNKIVLKGPIAGPGRWRVTIHDPSLYAATVLRETLEKHGVEVAGKVKRDRTVRASLDTSSTTQPTTWKLVAEHETSLLPVMEKTNKDSNNLYAECFGKRTAAAMFKAPGSWKSVTQTQAAFMETVGAPADDYVFDDGCGLSKENAVAPAAFCATLAYMFHGNDRDAYLRTLAIGGVDGTLSKRYKTEKDLPNELAGRVFGKSGSVNGVSTLSGYLKARNGEWFAFSILCNKVGRGVAQPAQDDIVRAIDASAR